MGESYIRRKYNLVMLPPLSASNKINDALSLDNESKFNIFKYTVKKVVEDFINMDNETVIQKLDYTFGQIEDTFNLDNEMVTSVLRYTFGQIADKLNLDNETKIDVLRYTYAKIDDILSLDNATKIDVLRYTFAKIEDTLSLDNETKIDILRYTFSQIADMLNLDNETITERLDYTFGQIEDNLNLDNETITSVLDYTFGKIEDILNLDNETIVTAEEDAVQVPSLSNVFNIGPESARVTVTNTNDFYVYVYYSVVPTPESNDTTPDVDGEPRVLLAPSSFSSGKSFTINLENNFTLEGNNDYTFYARAYDQGLTSFSTVVNKAFSTPKYDFTDNPTWVASNLSIGQTFIQFSYKNENTVNATLVVTVLDNGNQAMDLLSESLQAGQTRTFNSNDYNDSFEANTTYTFNAKFTKTDYNDSGSTTNNVTTSKETTLTPTISSVNPSDTSVTFNLKNNDSDPVIAYYEVNDDTPDAYNVYLGAKDTATDDQDVTIPNLSASTLYTIWATAEATGKNRSSAASSLFQTDAPPPPPQTERPKITVTGTTENSVTFNIKNEDSSEATIKYEIGDDTPDASSLVVSGEGNTGPITLSNLNADTPYTIYATAQASGETLSPVDEEDFRTDAPPPPPQTAEPGITVTGTTENSVTFFITNNDDDPVEVNYSINTSPPITGFIPSVTNFTSPITRTGLSPDSPYTITVTAQASGKTLSEPATEPFSTDTPPPTTYTLRARSSGVSPVNVTIGGTGYTLTTSYQNVDTTTSSKTTTLVAPTQVIVGSDTYTFTQWRNVTTNTTISTVNSTSIIWSSDTNIEAIYVLVPQLGGF